MKKLRDMNLRWSNGDPNPAPDWFSKRSIVEYFFVRELAALKIETPGFVKINVYFEPKPVTYDGGFDDGIANVDVSSKLTHPETLSPKDFVDFCLDLMVAGVKIVLEHFGISTIDIDKVADLARIESEIFSIPLNRKAAKSPTGHLARLHVRPLSDLTGCVVVLVLYKGKASVGERIICTTFPPPDIAIDRFESLVWEGDDIVIATFKTVLFDRKVYGRTNFDSEGMKNVQRIEIKNSEPSIVQRASELIFKIDVSDLVPSN